MIHVSAGGECCIKKVKKNYAVQHKHFAMSIFINQFRKHCFKFAAYYPPLLVHVLKRQHPIIFEKLKCQCSEIHYPWTESKRRKKIGLLGVY